MNGSANGKADIIFALAILAFSALVYWQSLSLPPPRYEPMGSAALPQALSVIMAVLALVVLVRALVQRRKPGLPTAANNPESGSATIGFVSRPWVAATAFIATAVYVAVMDLKLAAYPITTIIYLTSNCLLLTIGDWRQLRWIIPFAAALSLICYFVFTRIFYIDLP